MRSVLLAALLILEGCADQHENFIASCREVARVKIYDAPLWSAYVQQLHQEQEVAADKPVPLFPTKDFSSTSQWAASGSLIAPKADIPYADYYNVTSLKTKRLIARADNLSMRRTGFGSEGATSCITEIPQLYKTILIENQLGKSRI